MPHGKKRKEIRETASLVRDVNQSSWRHIIWQISRSCDVIWQVWRHSWALMKWLTDEEGINDIKALQTFIKAQQGRY